MEALAGLFEVTVASLGRGKTYHSEVLPLESTPGQPLALCVVPGPLYGEQVDIAWKGDAPCCQPPG